MFNKIKALKDVRSQAKALEKALGSVEATGTHKGVRITINGKQEILSVEIPEELERSEIGEGVKGAMADAFKQIQTDVQRVMKDMGGLPDLSQLGL